MPNKKEKRGRPTDNPARDIICIRVPTDRKSQYRKAARKSGTTMSVWVLDACDRAILS